MSLGENGGGTDYSVPDRILRNGETADKCVACGACEAACPQHLEIIEGLRNAWSTIGA